MREIKFRAWIKKDERMESCISINPFHIGDCDRFLWKHEEVELMQFTGLKDKNGNEIYEGDIIRSYNDFGDSFEDLSIVIWNQEGASFDGVVVYDIKNEEIIGNIHENPELLA